MPLRTPKILSRTKEQQKQWVFEREWIQIWPKKTDTGTRKEKQDVQTYSIAEQKQCQEIYMDSTG